MKIPMLDAIRQYESLEEELDRAVLGVLSSGRYIRGPEGAAFEKEVAAHLGVPAAVGVANGTDALHLALWALGVGPGDEVITTPFTFLATAEVVRLLGAVPVFVDIDPASYCIDPRLLEEAVTERTRAILPVHLFGHPCDMDGILEVARRHGIPVVEDAAQAFGAEHRGQRVGGIGDLGCFSFFPSKNLGAAGDGGLVSSRSPELLDAVRTLSNHGSRAKYLAERIGVNSRLDDLQAAILRVKLPRVEGWNRRRREAVDRYRERLEGAPVGLPLDAPNGLHVYHQLTVRLRDRDRVQEALTAFGIASAVYYPVPIHLLPPYRTPAHPEGSLPEAERAAHEVLSLPIFPEITPEEVDRIAEVVRAHA
jgi:dTDP-4-amino-4,6-dideoxygalactose transaminase